MAAFRTRDDPKHDVVRQLPHVLVPPELCSSRKENRDVGTTEDHFVCRTGDDRARSLAPWRAGAGGAEEVESYLSMGQPRATEAAVQKDIKSLFSQYEKDKPFDWHVKRQRVLGKKVIYDYRVRPEKIVTTDWVYIHSGQEYLRRSDS